MRATWSLFAWFGRGLVIALTAVAVLEAVALAQQEVTFPDANLEAAIRDALNKPQGPVTDADLAGLTRLDDAYLDYDTHIDDLTGLEHCTALQKLHLSGNQISDLTPLSGLTSLQRLWLDYNQISDLTPLGGLTNLQGLGLLGNQISDLTPLSGLTNLERLLLAYNQVSHLTPLSGLTSLQRLWLDYNQISDLTPLSRLTNLERLELEGNPLDEAAYQLHIPALQAAGVDVSFDPVTGAQAAEGPALPSGYALYPNAPNPFNPVTRIAYDLPEATHVALTIHNAAGYRIATLVSGTRQAGRHTVLWDGVGFASGVYFYRIEANSFSQARRMVLLK